LKKHAAIENVSAPSAATAEAVHQFNRPSTPQPKYCFESGPVDDFIWEVLKRYEDLGQPL
jgi:hypothetical protein